MPEPLVLLVGLLMAAALVVQPLLQRRVEGAMGEDERDAAAVRHRVAIETLRDVEADRSAGSLDDAAYADQLAQAEAHAAETRAALEQPTAQPARPHAAEGRRRLGLVAAGVIGALLMVGALLPATGLANRVVVNQALADAQAGEAERQDRIVDLLGALDPDAPDTATLSALADAYLAGSTGDDLVRAAVTL